MYDFCLTLPYGVLLLVGGAAGFFLHGSTVSLAAGGLSGLLLIMLGSASYREYQQSGSVSKIWSLVSLVISTVLSVVMGLRYQKTQKLVPAGAIAAASGFMTAFYLYKIAFGDKKKKSGAKKAE